MEVEVGQCETRMGGLSLIGMFLNDFSRRGLGSRFHVHFAHLGGVDLDVPDRHNRAADLVRRRARIAELFVTGDWGVELETFEADQERERQQEAES